VSLLLENNSTVDEYLKNVSIQNKSSAEIYRYRLITFQKFVRQQYNLTLDQLIDTMTQMGHGPKIDVYKLLGAYVSYLKENTTTAPLTIKHYLSTVRNYLESFDIVISPRTLKFKVKTPKVVRCEKEALTKEDIRTILEACTSIRQKTYILFWHLLVVVPPRLYLFVKWILTGIKIQLPFF
jgi:hypothetical protein